MKTLDEAMKHAAHAKSVDACSESGRALTILHDHISALPLAVTDEQINTSSARTWIQDAVTRLERQDSTQEERFAAADGLRALLSAQPAAVTPLDYDAARTDAYRQGVHDERVRQKEDRAQPQEAKAVAGDLETFAWLIEDYDRNDNLRKRVVLSPLTEHLDESAEAIPLCKIEDAKAMLAAAPQEPAPIYDHNEGDGLAGRIQREPAQAGKVEAAIPVENEPRIVWSANEEDFREDSLGELLDNHDDLEPGRTVYFGTAVPPTANQLCDADDIIEMIGERAYDFGGEYAEDFPDVSQEATDELQAFIAAWITKHCVPTFYQIEKIQQRVLTDDDFDADDDRLQSHSSNAGGEQ